MSVTKDVLHPLYNLTHQLQMLTDLLDGYRASNSLPVDFSAGFAASAGEAGVVAQPRCLSLNPVA